MNQLHRADSLILDGSAVDGAYVVCGKYLHESRVSFGTQIYKTYPSNARNNLPPVRKKKVMSVYPVRIAGRHLFKAAIVARFEIPLGFLELGVGLVGRERACYNPGMPLVDG